MLALLSLIDEYVGVSNTNMHLRAGVGKTAKVLVPAPRSGAGWPRGKNRRGFRGLGYTGRGMMGIGIRYSAGSKKMCSEACLDHEDHLDNIR